MYFFATSDHPTEVIVDAEDTGAYIEKQLFISKNTVKTHLRHIYQKTQTGNKEELLVLFEQQA